MVECPGLADKPTGLSEVSHRHLTWTPSPDHLDYYLDEFTFRFNRRTSRHRGKLFYRLLQQAVMVGPAPYDSLIKHVRGPAPRPHKRQ